MVCRQDNYQRLMQTFRRLCWQLKSAPPIVVFMLDVSLQNVSPSRADQYPLEDFAAYDIVPGDIEHGLMLICDHACNQFPDRYGTLGLPASELERHIAYDIGVDAVTRQLAERLNVPAVLSEVLPSSDRPQSRPGRSDIDHAGVGRGCGARQCRGRRGRASVADRPVLQTVPLGHLKSDRRYVTTGHRTGAAVQFTASRLCGWASRAHGRLVFCGTSATSGSVMRC